MKNFIIGILIPIVLFLTFILNDGILRTVIASIYVLVGTLTIVILLSDKRKQLIDDLKVFYKSIF